MRCLRWGDVVLYVVRGRDGLPLVRRLKTAAAHESEARRPPSGSLRARRIDITTPRASCLNQV
jgi:hypothetical protein